MHTCEFCDHESYAMRRHEVPADHLGTYYVYTCRDEGMCDVRQRERAA